MLIAEIHSVIFPLSVKRKMWFFLQKPNQDLEERKKVAIWKLPR